MLDRIVDEQWLTANGVVGLFPANAVGDDIEVYLDEHARRGARRPPPAAAAGRSTAPAYRTGRLADYVAPKETGLKDYVGRSRSPPGSAARTGSRQFKAELDDYSAILLESLADRLAEAFAERLHERVRRELWGYAPDEHLDNGELIKEQYARHPARRRATPRAPTTPRSRRSGTSSTSRRTPA